MALTLFRFRSWIVALLVLSAACESNSSATIEHKLVEAPAIHPTTMPTTASAFPQSTNPRDTLPFLASDALEGRAPGTEGLQTAGNFLAGEFARIGLQTLPNRMDFFQPFTMSVSTTVMSSTQLLVNEKPLAMNTDFAAMSMSGQKTFSGNVVFAGYGITREKEKDYDDYANLDVHGKIVLAMRQEPCDAQGHSKFADKNQQWSTQAYLGAKAANAARHGAVALLLVRPPSSGGADGVTPYFLESGSIAVAIPVLQVSRRIADLLLTTGGAQDLKSLQLAIDAGPLPKSTELNDVQISGNVALKRTVTEVRNVMAYLPGIGPHADEFVVVGAHYDHLGTVQMGHMLGPTGSIYHGADDNASGTAAVIELADKLKAAGPLPRSVVFIFFTAEEEGLVGSDYFIKHPPIALEKIVAMLNMDMVGRLKDDTVMIGGWGTAPIFDQMVKDAAAASGLKTQSFEKGGLGPSDHMAFALKQIPVLFLFTGLHADYHRPTDTADKVNYDGIDKIDDVARQLVVAMAAMPRQQYDGSSDSKSTMAFATGHDDGTHRAALGIVPDFSSSDAKAGVAISGVGQNSPAALAGLKAGDVLPAYNDRPLNNLQDLSDALNQAKPGDSVVIKLLRDGKAMEVHATLGERKE